MTHVSCITGLHGRVVYLLCDTLSHSFSEDQFVFEFVGFLRFILSANDRECFFFSRIGIVLLQRSRLKGTPDDPSKRGAENEQRSTEGTEKEQRRSRDGAEKSTEGASAE